MNDKINYKKIVGIRRKLQFQAYVSARSIFFKYYN